jgi:L-ascorbate metabolism protein UlaG (beta-lactamase superfamily)
MELGKDLILLGHASFLLKHDGKNIFIDPFNIQDQKEKADLILVTHGHPDHWSPADIDKIIKRETKIICSPLCEGSENYQNLSVMRPLERTSALGLEIETTRAYNLNAERLKFHPKSNDWLGIVITVDGKRIYHAGDTDFIPEMRDLKRLHVALLPMGGTYTMTTDEMIEAAKAIDAEHIVPIHYKRLLGDKAPEAEARLKKSVKNALILSEMR